VKPTISGFDPKMTFLRHIGFGVDGFLPGLKPRTASVWVRGGVRFLGFVVSQESKTNPCPGAKTGVWEPIGDRMNADGGREVTRSGPTGRAASAETPSQGCVRRGRTSPGLFSALPTGGKASVWLLEVAQPEAFPAIRGEKSEWIGHGAFYGADIPSGLKPGAIFVVVDLRAEARTLRSSASVRRRAEEQPRILRLR